MSRNVLSIDKHPARLAFLVSLIFFVIALIVSLNHELWLDETEPWLLARDSPSFSELFFNKRYEGHPDLWYVVLFLVTSVTTKVVAMQVLHVTIAATSVYLFLRYAPFPFLIRVLFCFGYFFVYEYAAISRLYAIEMLLTFTVCVLYPNRQRYWLLFWFLLFLNAQTNFFGMLTSAAIAGLTILQSLSNARERLELSERRWKFVAGLIVFICGLAWSVKSMIPPADCYYAAGWNTSWEPQRAAESIALIWQSFVPIPEFHVKDWNSNIISSVPLKAIFSLVIYALTLFSLRRKPLVLLAYFGVTLAMLAFFYTKLPGSSIRHQGHLFTVYFVFLWIYRSADEALIARTESKWPMIVCRFLLGVHVFVGGYALIKELNNSFSENKMVADFIQELPYECTVVAYDDLNSSPLSAYLNTPVYYPARKMFGSYYQLTENGRSPINPDLVLDEAHRIAVEKNQNVVVVFDDKDQLIHMPKDYPVNKIFETRDEGVIGPPYFVVLVSPK